MDHTPSTAGHRPRETYPRIRRRDRRPPPDRMAAQGEFPADPKQPPVSRRDPAGSMHGMSGERRAPDRTGPARRSAIDIRALLTDREYIKTTAYLLPRRAKIRVLEMMERLRSLRKDRRERGAGSPPSAVPAVSG